MFSTWISVLVNSRAFWSPQDTFSSPFVVDGTTQRVKRVSARLAREDRGPFKRDVKLEQRDPRELPRLRDREVREIDLEKRAQEEVERPVDIEDRERVEVVCN